MAKLIVHNEKCTGCRACEIACSYHHQKKFNPRLASLQVHRMEKAGRMSVLLYQDLVGEEKRGRVPCDQCVEEPEPLCVKYCAPGAITTI